MKIDQNYLLSILEAFEDFPKSTMTITDLQKIGFILDDEKFITHMEYVNEIGLIQLADGAYGIGLKRGIGDYTWSVQDLRITAQGRDYLNEKKA